jgi:4-hydroxy 2-oxovalerate aldolase
VFISNRKRLYSFKYEDIKAKIIVTSNLPKLTNNFVSVKYDDLCDNEFEQPDNAGMMLIRLLKNNGVEKVYLAGFDGFSSPEKENYYSKQIANHNTVEVAEKKNKDITKQIAKVSKGISLEFVTKSVYQGTKNE